MGGSRRAFARGEFNEPHGPLGLDVTEAPTWAPGMWEALKAAVEDPSVPSVAWDALWSSAGSPVNQNVTEWDMKKLMLKSKPKPSQAPSICQVVTLFWRLSRGRVTVGERVT